LLFQLLLVSAPLRLSPHSLNPHSSIPSRYFPLPNDSTRLSLRNFRPGIAKYCSGPLQSSSVNQHEDLVRRFEKLGDRSSLYASHVRLAAPSPLLARLTDSEYANSHWTPIANNWGDDRRWGWLGTAIRIATEIKLHKTLNQTTYDFYRSVTPLSDDAFQKLSDDRIRSWRLISVCETAYVSLLLLLLTRYFSSSDASTTIIRLGVSTGRLGAISNLCSVWPGPPTPPNLSRDHPHYNTYAILELTKIYVCFFFSLVCLTPR